MRNALGRFLGVLVGVLLPFALLSAWLDAVVTDTDAYVDAVAPLAEDPAVRDAAAERVEQLVVDELQDATGVELGAIPREFVGVAAQTAVDSEIFPRAWRAGNVATHREFVRVMEGRSGQVDDGFISLGLGTMLEDALGVLSVPGVLSGVDPSGVDVSIPLLRTDDLERSRGAYETLETAGFWLPVATALLLVLALVVGRDRGPVLRWASVVGLLMLALLSGVVVLARGTLVDAAVTDLDGVLVEAVVNALLSPLWASMVAGAVAAVVAFAGSFLLRRARPASPAPA